MSEPIGLVKTVAPFGNSAHVTIPRPLIGEEVYVVPKGQLTYLSAIRRSEGLQGIGVRPNSQQFTAHAVNIHGEEMVMVANRKQPKPVLYHEDMDWAPLQVMQAAGELVVVRDDLREDVYLSPQEMAWVTGCLALANIPVDQLPSWKPGESLRSRMGRAMLSGDRKKQIAVLEEVLAQLKSEG
ncbi:MAG TPA: DUF2080 family transposase-associated protein [Candidatus Thermoplasmatota archaeon]|nr:DUF2080 family transposase-associated protein [Candidatus Thermoplasmatota archaeon]